jgi:hypothetical protein
LQNRLELLAFRMAIFGYHSISTERDESLVAIRARK